MGSTRAEGFDEDKAEGIIQEKAEIICRLYKNGLSLDTIAMATETSRKEIREILEKNSLVKL